MIVVKNFEVFRKIPSFKEYVLVSQDRPQIERFFLNQSGKWELTEVSGIDSVLDLLSLKCSLKMSEVYELVAFKQR